MGIILYLDNIIIINSLKDEHQIRPGGEGRGPANSVFSVPEKGPHGQVRKRYNDVNNKLCQWSCQAWGFKLLPVYPHSRDDEIDQVCQNSPLFIVVYF